MIYNEEDDCYCPSGVAERTENSIKTVWYIVLAGITLAVLKAIVEVLGHVVLFVGKATRGLSEFVDIVGWIILGVAAFIITGLYVHDKVMNYIERRELPWYVSIMVKLHRAIRSYFYHRDLQQRFDERPELSLLTIDDIMADMNDGHHDGEKPRSKEELADYLEQFYKIKDERSGKGRVVGIDLESVSHN